MFWWLELKLERKCWYWKISKFVSRALSNPFIGKNCIVIEYRLGPLSRRFQCHFHQRKVWQRYFLIFHKKFYQFFVLRFVNNVLQQFGPINSRIFVKLVWKEDEKNLILQKFFWNKITSKSLALAPSKLFYISLISKKKILSFFPFRIVRANNFLMHILCFFANSLKSILWRVAKSCSNNNRCTFFNQFFMLNNSIKLFFRCFYQTYKNFFVVFSVKLKIFHAMVWGLSLFRLNYTCFVYFFKFMIVLFHKS